MPASRHWQLMWFQNQRSLPPRCGALPVQAVSLHAAPFDFWGGFSAAEHINEIGATLDEDMRVIRDYRRARPLFWPNGMSRLWRDFGLTDVTEVPIVISFDFKSFDDYWTSLCTGPNSMAQRMKVMAAKRRDEIRRLVMSSYLAGMEDGPRSFASIVRSVRGVVP